MSSECPTQTCQRTGRWIPVGLVFAWLMIVGGLIGVLASRLQHEPSSGYLALVASGTILNAVLLNLPRRGETASKPGATAHGAHHAE